MNVIQTPLKDLIVLEPTVHGDHRGYFMETYKAQSMPAPLTEILFLQDNEAMSNSGVLRGLHYQTGNDAQAKLVRVITGAVYDVVVDIRTHSPTYGQHFGIELSAENKRLMFVPKGFAHGYLVLADNTIFSYKCDQYYNPTAEAGIKYDDDTLAIEWPEIQVELLISDKDKLWPQFGNHTPSGI